MKKAILPAAIAIAMVGFIGAFGGSGIRTAEAVEGDICHADVGWAGGALELFPNLDGQGNSAYLVGLGFTSGIVFRVEDDWGDNTTVSVDSETGSARITSYAELVSSNNVDHVLVGGNGVGTQDVDTMDPSNIDDPDGNPLVDINDWLEEVAGLSDFADSSDAVSGCGSSDNDGWGFIDFECIESGVFHIDIQSPDDTEESGLTLKFLCVGQADTATIKTQRTTLETHPTGVAPGGFGESIITVTVEDQFGNRIDGVEVTLTTDNCTFTADPNTQVEGASFISPAGGGKTVTIHTDSDVDEPAAGDQTTDDEEFLIDNPLEVYAGTAEAILDCGVPGPTGTPGVANITAVVQRAGSDIVLDDLSGDGAIIVVGQTAATGLTLTLTPDDIECGETIKATAKAVDANGAPVSNGTIVHFTTDTSSGVIGGVEGAQGTASTIGGEASVLIATDPGNPGVHTVIAFVMNAAGTPSAQASDTYTCEGAVAPAAPTVAPPSTGTGTITPPNTGDAGLAAGSTSSSLLVIAGAVAFVLAGLASIRFARN